MFPRTLLLALLVSSLAPGALRAQPSPRMSDFVQDYLGDLSCPEARPSCLLEAGARGEAAWRRYDPSAPLEAPNPDLPQRGPRLRAEVARPVRNLANAKALLAFAPADGRLQAEIRHAAYRVLEQDGRIDAQHWRYDNVVEVRRAIPEALEQHQARWAVVEELLKHRWVGTEPSGELLSRVYATPSAVGELPERPLSELEELDLEFLGFLP